MEAKKPRLDKQVTDLDSPFFIRPVLPTSFLKSSQPLAVPLIAAAHSLGNPLQQLSMPQQPLMVSPPSQSPAMEHVLLFPNSGLSPAENQSITSTSLLSSTKLATPCPVAQNSPVLVNSGRPHSPNFQTPESSHPLMVLPVSPNPLLSLNKNFEPDTICKTQMVTNQKTQPFTGLRENVSDSSYKNEKLLSPKVTKSSNICSVIAGLNKNDSSDTAGSKCSEIVNTPNVGITNADISSIISNLPSGWKVVGFTDGLQTNNGKKSPASPVTEDCCNGSKSPNEDQTLKKKPCTSNDFITDQPSVVSVNLNSSFPTTLSETPAPESAMKLTCSIELDNIPCSHVIGIKKECVESDQDNETRSEVQSQKETGVKTAISRVTGDGDGGGGSEGLNSCTSERTKPLLPVKTEPVISVPSQTSLDNQQWTIIGVTSLPVPPMTNVAAINKMVEPNATSIMSRSSQLSASKENNNMSSSSKSSPVILKIPPGIISDSRQDAGRSNQVGESLHSSSLVPLSLNSSQGLNTSGKHETEKVDEEMRWTVIGIAGATGENISGQQEAPSVLNLTNVASIRSPTLSASPNSKEVTAAVLPTNFDLTSSSLCGQRAGPAESLGTSKEISQAGTKMEYAATIPHQVIRDSEGKCEMKNSEPNQIENQWKVVGITPLGGPAQSVKPFVPLPQSNVFGQLSSDAQQFISSPSPLFSPGLTTPTTAKSDSSIPPFLHPSLLPLSSSSSSSSVPALTMSSSLPIPLVGLGNICCSKSPLVTSAAAAAGNPVTPVAPSPLSSDTSQTPDHSEQQNLLSMFQNQLAYPSPANVMTPPWSVVGVLANNQISMLNTGVNNMFNSPVISPPGMPLLGSAATARSGHSPEPRQPKAGPGAEGMTAELFPQKMKSSLSRSFDKRKSLKPSSEWKLQQLRSKGCSLKGNTNKIKKNNTVSNLLLMKRMHNKASSGEEFENTSEMVDSNALRTAANSSFDESANTICRKSRQRSLRSYAGNRTAFGRRMEGGGTGEMINLRSGTQVPLLSHSSDDNLDESMDMNHSNGDEFATVKSEVQHMLEIPMETPEPKVVLTERVEVQSAARKRKLKVPRKMVADLDYHPFVDSDSESN